MPRVLSLCVCAYAYSVLSYVAVVALTRRETLFDWLAGALCALAALKWARDAYVLLTSDARAGRDAR